jgi:uncharacterized membrane protein YeaQ/YmgE (transglycosylase-associated protein family)
MNSRKFTMLGMVVGSIGGGYLPTMWGESGVSFAALVCSVVGGILGIVVGYRMSQ